MKDSRDRFTGSRQYSPMLEYISIRIQRMTRRKLDIPASYLSMRQQYVLSIVFHLSDFGRFVRMFFQEICIYMWALRHECRVASPEIETMTYILPCNCWFPNLPLTRTHSEIFRPNYTVHVQVARSIWKWAFYLDSVSTLVLQLWLLLRLTIQCSSAIQSLPPRLIRIEDRLLW